VSLFAQTPGCSEPSIEALLYFSGYGVYQDLEAIFWFLFSEVE
jgi:hypothetical protein